MRSTQMSLSDALPSRELKIFIASLEALARLGNPLINTCTGCVTKRLKPLKHPSCSCGSVNCTVNNFKLRIHLISQRLSSQKPAFCRNLAMFSAALQTPWLTGPISSADWPSKPGALQRPSLPEAPPQHQRRSTISQSARQRSLLESFWSFSQTLLLRSCFNCARSKISLIILTRGLVMAQGLRVTPVQQVLSKVENTKTMCTDKYRFTRWSCLNLVKAFIKLLRKKIATFKASSICKAWATLKLAMPA